MGVSIQASRSLLKVAKGVKVVELPSANTKGFDLSDWLDAGGTREQLDQLVEEAPESRENAPQSPAKGKARDSV